MSVSSARLIVRLVPFAAGMLCIILAASSFNSYGQPFSISSTTFSNYTIQIQFPSRSDSYYLLYMAPTLNTTPAPVSAQLGSGGFQFFQNATTGKSSFFRILQSPLTATNDLIGDGIPDGWKLQNGLNPLGPSVASQIAPGYDITWLQVYQYQSNLVAAPLAYFPTNLATVLVGSSNATLQVAFTKPYNGFLTYQLSGTAIPAATGVAGDYIQPPGSVFVPNTTVASISIRLVPETDIEVNRSIVVAISAPPASSQTYAISTNSSVATIQIVQSTQGLYVGSLSITNGMYAGVQSVKIALRPSSGTNTSALFDVTGNALLGSTFTVPVSASTNGFQLNGSQYSNILTNTPWGRNLNVNLAFGSTQTADSKTFTTPVTLNLEGLTASGQTYSGTGMLTVSRSQ